MSEILFIFTVILMSACLPLFFARCSKSIFYIVFLAFLFRLVLIFLDYHGIFMIPGARHDASVFTERAFYLSSLSHEEFWDNFRARGATLYSFTGAWVMRGVGSHQLIMPAMNLFTGVLVVGITALIALKIWGERAAVIAGAIMALYPFAAFNSAIALREEFAILFFVGGLYFFVKWVRLESVIGIYLALALWALATALHPGWLGAFVGLALYLLYIVVSMVGKSVSGAWTSRLFVVRFGNSLAVFMLAVLFFVASGGLTLGKGIEVGGEAEGGVAEMIESRFERDPRGGSAYPGAIATGNPYTQPWLIPARIVYFHFSPFPWDVRSPRHVLGLLSSWLYLFLAWRVYKGWDNLKHKEECVAMLFIFGALTFIFAIGVTNVGTAIRHKTKLLALFVILAASSFDRLRFRFR
jgi:hypothetical protein